MLLENSPPPPHNFSNGPSLIDHRRCPAYLERQVALVFIENTQMSQSADFFHSIS